MGFKSELYPIAVAPAILNGTDEMRHRETAAKIERRRHPRLQIQTKVQVRLGNSVQLPDLAFLINASRKGILLLTDRKYPIGTDVLVAYPYPDELALEQKGSVARMEEVVKDICLVAIAIL